MKTKNDKIKEILSKIDSKSNDVFSMLEKYESELASKDFDVLCSLYGELLALSIIPEILSGVTNSEFIAKIIRSFRETISLLHRFSVHCEDENVSSHIAEYSKFLREMVNYDEDMKSEIDRFIFEGEIDAKQI